MKKVRNKGVNFGYLTKHKSKKSFEALHLALRDMYQDAVENDENLSNEYYIPKHLCTLNPKTFIKRYL